MNPHGYMGFLAAALGWGGMLSKAPSRETVLLMRLDRAEAAHVTKMASPAYHAALAKRERKRQKLLAQ